MTAASLDRNRLARVLGMLGSDHPGEVVAAARQAERLRAEAGLTWQQIMVPRLPAPPQRQNVGTVAEAVDLVLEHEEVLTPWERNFARDIRRQAHSLSPKQLVVLERLLNKVRQAGAMAA